MAHAILDLVFVVVMLGRYTYRLNTGRWPFGISWPPKALIERQARRRRAPLILAFPLVVVCTASVAGLAYLQDGLWSWGLITASVVLLPLALVGYTRESELRAGKPLTPWFHYGPAPTDS